MTVSENIDLGAPTMNQVHPRLGTCKATDPLSGVESCKVTKTRTTRNRVTTVRWTAKATDHAGNVYKRYGTYKVRA